MSLLRSRNGPSGPGVPDRSTLCSLPTSQLRKRPRMDMNPVVQLQINDSTQYGRLWKKPECFQAPNPIQQAQLLQQEEEKLKRQKLQPASGINLNGGFACTERFMTYLHYLRQKPTDNNLAYWKCFVNTFYSPHAKKRWCTSLYSNVGQHLHKVAWQCGLCSSTSGMGFESTFEVLPLLYQVKFGSGVINELFFLESSTTTTRLSSGRSKLVCESAVQETVYAQGRVVHRGQLCVIFASDLKIVSWEFCAREHEELVRRGTLSHKVNQLMQVVQQYEAMISGIGPGSSVSQSDLLASSEVILTAAHQLIRSSQFPTLDEFGFSVRFSAFLRTKNRSNNVGSQMDFCAEQNPCHIGNECHPSGAAFNKFSGAATPMKHGAQDMQQRVYNPSSLLHGRTTSLNRQTAQHPGFCSSMSSNQCAVGLGPSDGRAQAVNNHQNMTGQNSTGSYQLGEPSLSTSGVAFSPGPSCIVPRTLPDSPASGALSNHALQQYSPGQDGGLQKNQDTLIQGSQELQQDMCCKGDNIPVPQQPILRESREENMPKDDPIGKSPPAAVANESGSEADGSCLSFKDALRDEFPEPDGNYGVDKFTEDLPLDYDLLFSSELFFDENFDLMKTDFENWNET